MMQSQNVTNMTNRLHSTESILLTDKMIRIMYGIALAIAAVATTGFINATMVYLGFASSPPMISDKMYMASNVAAGLWLLTPFFATRAAMAVRKTKNGLVALHMFLAVLAMYGSIFITYSAARG